MSAQSIFDYSGFSDYFAASIAAKKEKDPSFSYGVLTRKLGRKSPSLLAMIARGERYPANDLLVQLCEYFKMSPRETEYTESLVNFTKSKSIKDRAHFAKRLRALKPTHNSIIIALDTVELIAHWYHFTILEMSTLPPFIPDAARISNLLGPTVSVEMVDESLALLKRVGLLKEDSLGIPRKIADIVKTTPNIPSQAVRALHKQLLSKAHQAIERQSIQERYFTGATFAISKSKMELAKQKIAQFRDDLMRELTAEQDGGEEIYHFAVQFFRTTALPLEKQVEAASKSVLISST